MQDFMNLVMLICASLASMVAGVMLAYGVFKVGFGLMRFHAEAQEPIEKAQAQVARVL